MMLNISGDTFHDHTEPETDRSAQAYYNKREHAFGPVW